MSILIDQWSKASNSITAELLKYLVTRPGIGLGSRILICGVANGELLQGLADLGLLVTCTHEDAVESESLRQTVPEANCCEGNVPREQFDSTGAAFDLIVVSVAAINECGSVFSRWRMLELAGLLACLHPRGFLVMLGKAGPHGDSGVTHSLRCCQRMLNELPGQSRSHTFGSGMLQRFTAGRREFAIALQVPDRRLSPFEWSRFTTDAAKRLPSECCQISLTLGDESICRAA